MIWQILLYIYLFGVVVMVVLTTIVEIHNRIQKAAEQKVRGFSNIEVTESPVVFVLTFAAVWPFFFGIAAVIMATEYWFKIFKEHVSEPIFSRLVEREVRKLTPPPVPDPVAKDSYR